MKRILWSIAAVTMVLVPSGVSNHVQSEDGRAIVFDHKTGNDWWVEVVLTGQDAGSVATVQAMDTGGPWVTLSKKSWGAWGASFRIETGHLVKFRASWAGGAQIESCWFQHPSGVEQCPTEPHPDCVDDQGRIVACPFDATFSNVKGNDWWVQAKVTANQPIAGVDARVNCGGPWKPLTLRSWGAWAASFHIPSGSKVDLRARSGGGSEDRSGGYIWPQATPTSACPTDPILQMFRADFTRVRGNEWWQETDVVANRDVASVELRMDGGPWRSMSKTSWGSWATSVRAEMDPFPPIVEFRARSTAGAIDVSPMAWVWQSEGPSVMPGLRDAEAFWAFPEGDTTRIEVNTFSNRIRTHMFREGGGEWQKLHMNADGDWFATDLALPENAMITFEILFEGGGTIRSDPFPWPPWPQPGSWADYRFRSRTDFPDGSFETQDGYTKITQVRGGAQSECTILRVQYFAESDTWRNTTFTGPLQQARIPLANPDTAVGWHETVPLPEACFLTGHEMEVADRGTKRTNVRTISGDPIDVDAWHAIATWDDPPNGWNAWWESETGLVVSYDKLEHVGNNAGSTYQLRGWLLDTDAPWR